MPISYRGTIRLTVGDGATQPPRARATCDVERVIAGARVLLSLIAVLTLSIDCLQPRAMSWLALGRGPFDDPRWRCLLLGHLGYSVALFLLQSSRESPSPRLAQLATWGDVLFAALVAFGTRGLTSPYYSFFAFAVLATGIRSGLRSAMLVTTVGVFLDATLMMAASPDGQTFPIVMRVADLAITGCLVARLGQGRLDQEAHVRSLEQQAQREQIARWLHDGHVQALTAVSWRIDACRELLRRGHGADAESELAQLQAGVDREHDALRGYVRSLIDLEARLSKPPIDAGEALVSVQSDFQGSAPFVEHVLSILLEATRNVRRHARASSAVVRARSTAGALEVSIDDDGVGFAPGAPTPWSILSRVAECGGRLTVDDAAQDGAHVGAHVHIRLPEG